MRLRGAMMVAALAVTVLASPSAASALSPLPWGGQQTPSCGALPSLRLPLTCWQPEQVSPSGQAIHQSPNPDSHPTIVTIAWGLLAILLARMIVIFRRDNKLKHSENALKGNG